MCASIGRTPFLLDILLLEVDIFLLFTFSFLVFLVLPQVCVCASIGGAPFLSPHHHKRQLPCYKLHTLLRLCYAIGTPPLFSPDMSKDSCMLKDCVSKAPATKNSSVLPNGPRPIWFGTRLWFTLSGGFPLMMFHGQTTKLPRVEGPYKAVQWFHLVSTSFWWKCRHLV